MNTPAFALRSPSASQMRRRAVGDVGEAVLARHHAAAELRGVGLLRRQQAPYRVLGPARPEGLRVVPAGKGSVDYLGHLKGRCLGVECKRVEGGDRWPLDTLPVHQRQELAALHLGGALAYVVLVWGCGRELRIVTLPWTQVRSWIAAECVSVGGDMLRVYAGAPGELCYLERIAREVGL